PATRPASNPHPTWHDSVPTPGPCAPRTTTPGRDRTRPGARRATRGARTGTRRARWGPARVTMRTGRSTEPGLRGPDRVTIDLFGADRVAHLGVEQRGVERLGAPHVQRLPDRLDRSLDGRGRLTGDHASQLLRAGEKRLAGHDLGDEADRKRPF